MRVIGNLERPFAEHRRPFPVVERIEPEQALGLLSCLAMDRSEVPDALIIPYLASENWRERIDAAVLLNVLGFGPAAADALADEADKPYVFGEIMGIGKSHYDTNFRDKCYLVMALAHHARDVDRLSTFADPKTRYRDVRYGLTIGLGLRGSPDGIDLLVEVANRDPISTIRCEARQSLRTIQEKTRLAGAPVPPVELGAAPFEVWYRPRGLNWPAAVVVQAVAVEPSDDEGQENLVRMVSRGLEPENYRNLNNSNNQAPGAKWMMIRRIHPFEQTVTLLTDRSSEAAESLLKKMVDSPYPFAHYLALREYAGSEAGDVDELLIAELDRFASSADTVRFYWACAALAARGVEAAVPQLARFATTENPAGLHGPLGMGLGYPAAKAIARIAGQIDDPQVRRLLTSENQWLRSGVLSGLIQGQAPGIEGLLEKVLQEHPNGVVYDHARVGLAQLRLRSREASPLTVEQNRHQQRVGLPRPNRIATRTEIAVELHDGRLRSRSRADVMVGFSLDHWNGETANPGCAALPRPWAPEYNAFGVKKSHYTQ